MKNIQTAFFCLFFIGLFIAPLASAEHSRFEIYPNQVQMQPNTNVVFTVVAYRHDGSAFTPDRIEWYSDQGSVNRGSYTSPSHHGHFTVSARWRGRTATCKVHVKETIPVIKRIHVTPEQTTLKPGQQCQFQAVAYDRYNRRIPANFSWYVDGGKISSTGYYQAPYRKHGKYTITAVEPRTKQQGRAYVFVEQPSPVCSKLAIVPDNVRMRAGERNQFKAVAYDHYGKIVQIQPIWQASGGRIDQYGNYQAGYVKGRFEVWAKDPRSGVQAKAYVLIGKSHHPNPYPDPPQHEEGRLDILKYDVGGGNVFKPSAKIHVQVHGRTAQSIKLFAKYSNGRAVELQSFSCADGDTVKFKAEYSLGAKYMEILLYDNYHNVIARFRRSAN